MMRAALAVLMLITLGAIGASCSGGGGNSMDATSTANFEQLRDSLRDRLDSVGANIGFVPDDILEQMINDCHELGTFVDEDRISNLCDAIRRARDTNDPGLVDQIVVQLEQLERS